MDPISAIVGALVAGASVAATEVASKAPRTRYLTQSSSLPQWQEQTLEPVRPCAKDARVPEPMDASHSAWLSIIAERLVASE